MRFALACQRRSWTTALATIPVFFRLEAEDAKNCLSRHGIKGEACEEWSGEFFWRRRKVVIKRFMLERERGNNYSDKAHSGELDPGFIRDVAIGYGEEMQRSMNNYYPLVAK